MTRIGRYLRGIGMRLADAREDRWIQATGRKPGALGEILELLENRVRDMEGAPVHGAPAMAARRRAAAALLRETLAEIDRTDAPAVRPVDAEARLVELLASVSGHAGSGLHVQFNPAPVLPVSVLAAFDRRVLDLAVGAFASRAIASEAPQRWLAVSTELQFVANARYPHGSMELRLAYATADGMARGKDDDARAQLAEREAESLQRLVRDIDGALDVRTVRGVMTGIRLRMRVAKTW